MIKYDRKDIINTYTSLGYRNYKYDDFNNVLIKEDLNSLKVICVVYATPWFVRTTAFARKFVEGMLVTAGVEDVTEDNLLIVVIGGFSAYHFLGKNIIFYNIRTKKVHYRLVSKQMKAEVFAMYEDRTVAKYEEKARYVYWQEYNRHFPIIVFVFMALCIMSYVIRNSALYGYSANTVLNQNQAFRLISYMFMHGSLKHLICNMIALYYIGRNVEHIEGAFTTTILFLGSGIVGALLDCIYKLTISGDANTITVGASGAIMGLLGVYFVEAFMDRDLETSKFSVILNCLITLFISSIGTNIAVGCHVFGFIVGMMLIIPIKLSNTKAMLDKDSYYKYRASRIMRNRYGKESTYIGPTKHNFID